jgi:hypothetical protein
MVIPPLILSESHQEKLAFITSFRTNVQLPLPALLLGSRASVPVLMPLQGKPVLLGPFLKQNIKLKTSRAPGTSLYLKSLNHIQSPNYKKIWKM